MDPRLSAYLASLGAGPASLEGWEIQTARRGGEEVAFVITKGAEIHFVSIVGRRAMSRRNIWQFMAPLFDRYGYVATRVDVRETDHRLRLALGFTETWRDDRYSYWSMTTMPYQKQGAQPCQSQS